MTNENNNQQYQHFKRHYIVLFDILGYKSVFEGDTPFNVFGTNATTGEESQFYMSFV